MRHNRSDVAVVPALRLPAGARRPAGGRLSPGRRRRGRDRASLSRPRLHPARCPRLRARPAPRAGTPPAAALTAEAGPSGAAPTLQSSMEAATPLRPPHVRVLPGERVAVDGLVVDDPTAARLVGEREQRGEDPARLVADAIEIGARVLEREQTGANAEFIRAEMEKAARELDREFSERARSLGEE